MLNHIWTLLLNDSVSAPVTGRIGELPRDLNYKKVTLPSGLMSVRNSLYGATPDKEMLNYRSKQLLTCVLNSALAAYAFEFDARNTYNENTVDFLNATAYKPEPKLINGVSTLNMNISGSAVAPDASGIMRHSYTVVASDGVLNLTGLQGLTTTTTGAIANQSYALGISGYSFSLTDPTITQTWLIEFLNKPVVALGTLIANISRVGEPALNELFGITTDEPYNTFKNVFFNSSDLPLQCAAVTLALAYQTEKRRMTT